MKHENRIMVFLLCICIVLEMLPGLSLKVSAEQEKPIIITISLDKTEIEVGDTVTASYCISGGNGKIEEIQLEWEKMPTGSEGWSSVKWNYSSTLPLEGTYSCTATTGGKLCFDVYAKDSDGRWNTVYSDYVTVKDENEYPPISIEISLDNYK